jgi:hypothetical protein
VKQGAQHPIYVAVTGFSHFAWQIVSMGGYTHHKVKGKELAGNSQGRKSVSFNFVLSLVCIYQTSVLFVSVQKLN